MVIIEDPGRKKDPGSKRDGSKAAEKVSPGAPSLLSAHPDPVAQASWSAEEGGGGEGGAREEQ